MDTQKYCIVGTDKISGIRKCLSAHLTKEKAKDELWYWTDRQSKKIWKYVKIAKYPYKTKQRRSNE